MLKTGVEKHMLENTSTLFQIVFLISTSENLKVLKIGLFPPLITVMLILYVWLTKSIYKC